MTAKLSVEDVLSTLEERAVFHRDQEALHAQQEVHHREQRALHAAELVKVQASLEAFRAAAPTALELARERVAPAAEITAESVPEPAEQEDVTASGRSLGSRRVRKVVGSWSAEEPFGATVVAAEVNRRYRGQLKRPFDTRSVSNVLRRMQAEGWLTLVRPGKAFNEALYRRSGQVLR